MANTGGVSAVPEVNRGFTFALRRSTLDFCLGEQRSSAYQNKKTLPKVGDAGPEPSTFGVVSFCLRIQFYLTESFLRVVLQKSVPAQILQLILYHN